MYRKIGKITKVEISKGLTILLILIFFVYGLYRVSVLPVLAETDPVQTVVSIPPTLKPLNAPEVYGPENLYEKIDGQAELYLSAGFVRLASQWFSEAKDADSMFEVYIYHMGDELNSFSVYSAQRRPDAQKIDLARFAYQTKYSLCLVHGPYYVEMISTVPSVRILSEMTSAAQNFMRDTPVSGKSVLGFGFFPKENLDRESITLIAKNAFGFGGLDRVFTANYNIDGSRVTAFISKRESPQEAADLAAGLYGYLIAFGGKDVKPGIAIKDAKMVEVMETFDFMFSVDAYLAGIHEAPSKNRAEILADALAKTLREVLSAKQTNGAGP